MGCRRIMARIDNLPPDSAFVIALSAWVREQAPKKRRRKASSEEMKAVFAGNVRYVPDSQEPE